jgi:heme/copper-type cytochrome/quinol oxidase subunit 3
VLNGRGGRWSVRVALGIGVLAAAAAVAALAAGPWAYGMDPTAHAYPAIVWALVLWTGVHGAAGIVMTGFCLAGHFAGRLMPEYDADVWNVALYWHFMAFTAVVTTLVIGGFPLVA